MSPPSDETWLLLDSSGFGGIESHVLQLASALDGAARPVRVVLLADHGPHPLQSQLVARGIPCETLGGGLANLWHALGRRPRLIHTHGYKAGILARIACRLRGIPLVSTFHAGDNPAARPVTLVVRIDDTASSGYASRANPERVVGPGPFALRLSLAALRTPSGRPLNLDAVTRLIVFVADGDPAVHLDTVAVEEPPGLPEGAFGWDLGPVGSAPFPGFATLAPGGPALRALHRPAGDALLQDGIRGVRRLTVPLTNGRWRVSLWIEDLGAWETLPHPLTRTIRVNGAVVYRQRQTPQQWLEARYLAGRTPEAVVDGGPWALHGSRRGGLVTANIEVREQRLEVELDGDGPAGRYLAGVLVEPVATAPRALQAVERLRRERYQATWRTGTPPTAAPAARLTLHPRPFRHPFAPDAGSPAPAVGAPDSGLTQAFVALAPRDDDAPTLSLVLPRRGDVTLPATLRFGHWRYRRRGVASTWLDPVPDHLRADLDGLTLRAGLPRHLTVRVEIPPGTPPGHYRGTLRITSHGEIAAQPLDIEVLAVTLPPPGLPIGVYLEGAPHLDWFAALRPQRDRARRCDLTTLAELGLTGLAPPFATPDDAAEALFVADLKRAREAGFSADLLAYAPLKRLLARHPAEAVGTLLGRLEARLATTGLRPPIWSIADEPGHGDAAYDRLAARTTALRAGAPGIRLAGQLNRPDQAALLPLLDVALLNAGYGVDADDIEAVRAAGVAPWFYNLADPRLAAGFHLWRSGAEGYLQWHGRMPTADPFDPTDGREDDVQLLYPTAQACPPVADVDAALLALAEGIVDLRWLRWLENAASDGRTAAVELRDELRATLPGSWQAAQREVDPRALRARIQQLARRLQNSR